MEYGYIGISRKIFESWIYPVNQRRKFTEFEAWIEIIRLANFVCVEKQIQGKVIIVPRGYFDTTVRQLSNIFSWNERTTEKFLKLLEKQGMIKRYKISKSLKSCTLLKVNNYNDYQAAVYETCKSKYKSKCHLNCCNCSSKPEEEKPKRFTKPTLEEVEAYCTERSNGISAQDFINFYESKGWKVGKTPMKDWKAAVRTWEGKRKGTTKKPAAPAPAVDDFYMRLSR